MSILTKILTIPNGNCKDSPSNVEKQTRQSDKTKYNIKRQQVVAKATDTGRLKICKRNLFIWF